MSKSPAQDRRIRRLLTTPPQTVHLRDGDLVLYRRSRSLLYQCRYRLADGTWVRQTTGKAALEHAIAAACGRWIIAKHKAVEVLQRLHARQKDIAALSFETTLTKRVPHLLFRFSDGHQPHSLVGTFRRLMRDSGLALDANGDNRTLYSLRHTYATLEMLRGEVDIHTLSKQMGNSAAMIERHYSKLTATMAAERLA